MKRKAKDSEPPPGHLLPAPPPASVSHFLRRSQGSNLRQMPCIARQRSINHLLPPRRHHRLQNRPRPVSSSSSSTSSSTPAPTSTSTPARPPMRRTHGQRSVCALVSDLPWVQKEPPHLQLKVVPALPQLPSRPLRPLLRLRRHPRPLPGRHERPRRELHGHVHVPLHPQRSQAPHSEVTTVRQDQFAVLVVAVQREEDAVVKRDLHAPIGEGGEAPPARDRRPVTHLKELKLNFSVKMSDLSV